MDTLLIQTALEENNGCLLHAIDFPGAFTAEKAGGNQSLKWKVKSEGISGRQAGTNPDSELWIKVVSPVKYKYKKKNKAPLKLPMQIPTFSF